MLCFHQSFETWWLEKKQIVSLAASDFTLLPRGGADWDDDSVVKGGTIDKFLGGGILQ